MFIDRVNKMVGVEAAQKLKVVSKMDDNALKSYYGEIKKAHNPEKPYTVFFTGHRPGDLPNKSYNWCEEYDALIEDLTKTLIDIVEKHNKVIFVCGGAQGFDTLAAMACFAVRGNHPDKVKVVLAQPCAGQERMWGADGPFGQRAYRLMRHRFDAVRVVNGGAYQSWHMNARNFYMLLYSDECIALKNPNKNYGGTANTVRMAKACGLKVTILDTNKYWK